MFFGFFLLMFAIAQANRLYKNEQCVLYYTCNCLIDFFDFAVHLMKNNTAFTVLYTLYFLQLSIVTILCPGSTLLMLSFLVKLVAGIPLIVNAAVLWAICLAYCIVQISSLTAYKKLVLSKLLTLVLGILTTYVFVATSVYIVQMVIKGNIKFNKL